MNRREFTKTLFLSSAVWPLLQSCTQLQAVTTDEQASVSMPDFVDLTSEQAITLSWQGHQALMVESGLKMQGNEQIAMLMYPGFNPLDLVGPEYLFRGMMGARIYLVSCGADLSPVASGSGLAIVPSHTLNDCPEGLDLLFVPGAATGVIRAMEEPRILDFLRRQALSARYLTSVCTGSLLLGKAGLLQGKRATSHWLTLNLLAELGAIPVRERVVWDGRVVTGGGVTAGIDFGLEIVAAFRSQAYAEALQLDAEYDPAPPFNSGSPATARPHIRQAFIELYSPFLREAALAVKTPS